MNKNLLLFYHPEVISIHFSFGYFFSYDFLHEFAENLIIMKIKNRKTQRKITWDFMCRYPTEHKHIIA